MSPMLIAASPAALSAPGPEMFISLLLGVLPELVLPIVGLALALVTMRRHAASAGPALAGFGALTLGGLLGVCWFGIQFGLEYYAMGPSLIAGVLEMLLYVVGVGLVIAALYRRVSSASPPQAPPAPAPFGSPAAPSPFGPPGQPGEFSPPPTPPVPPTSPSTVE